MRTPNGRRHYNVEIGGGNAFAFFETDEDLTSTSNQYLNHFAIPVATEEEFNEALQLLKDSGLLLQGPQRNKATDRDTDQGGRTGPHGRPRSRAFRGKVYEVTFRRGRRILEACSPAKYSTLDPLYTGGPGCSIVPASPDRRGRER